MQPYYYSYSKSGLCTIRFMEVIYLYEFARLILLCTQTSLPANKVVTEIVNYSRSYNNNKGFHVLTGKSSVFLVVFHADAEWAQAAVTPKWSQENLHTIFTSRVQIKHLIMFWEGKYTVNSWDHLF